MKHSHFISLWPRFGDRGSCPPLPQLHQPWQAVDLWCASVSSPEKYHHLPHLFHKAVADSNQVHPGHFHTQVIAFVLNNLAGSKLDLTPVSDRGEVTGLWSPPGTRHSWVCNPGLRKLTGVANLIISQLDPIGSLRNVSQTHQSNQKNKWR